MHQRKPLLYLVGAVLIVIGVLTGILITIVQAVPDMESSLYGFVRYGYPRLTSLHCPVFMTTSDRLPVTVRLTNPLEQNLSWYVSTQLSTPVVMTTTKETHELQPGETKTLIFEVDRRNLDLYSFIFAHVFTSAGSLGMREATCGTFMLPISTAGGPTIFYSALGVFILFTAVGLGLWLRHADMSEPAVASRALWLRFLILLVALAVIASLLIWWFWAILLLILTMLTLIVALLR